MSLTCGVPPPPTPQPSSESATAEALISASRPCVPVQGEATVRQHADTAPYSRPPTRPRIHVHQEAGTKEAQTDLEVQRRGPERGGERAGVQLR